MAEPGAVILRMPSKYAPKAASPPAEASTPAEEVPAADAGADDAGAVEDSATAPGPSPPEPASSAPPAFKEPSLEWLLRTWAVTHSTLSMWRSARNVRITYTQLPPKPDGRARIDDLAEYELTGKTGVLKTVAGVDTQMAAVDGAWNWRGKGLLFLLSSQWEVLAWGEEAVGDGETERWAVVWFAATLFTKEGLDVYSDRREGLSAATYRRIEDALRSAGSEIAALAEGIMPVEISLPWIEK